MKPIAYRTLHNRITAQMALKGLHSPVRLEVRNDNIFIRITVKTNGRLYTASLRADGVDVYAPITHMSHYNEKQIRNFILKPILGDFR